ncbi:MAG: hypothetical protein WC740_07230 [Verrucomicrobiia bacterium]
MNAPLPAAITVREVLHGGGVRYALPRRPLGPLRFFGLLPLGVGAFFSLFAVGWMIAAAHGGGFFGWLFAIWGLPFFLAGFPPMAMGLAVLIGRCEIELRDGVLRMTEWAGPFHWSRRQPVNAIKRFNIRAADSANAPGFLGDLAALDADCGKPKPLLLALGYPREWLQALGDDLAHRCNLATADRILTPGKLAVETVTEPLHPSQPIAQRDDLNQPADSDILLEANADSVVVKVPPPGVWRGSKGLLIFSLFWCGFMVVFTGFPFFTGEGLGDATSWPLWLFTGSFWLIGIAMLAGAVNMGRRRAVLTVRADGLSIEQSSLFGAKRAEWGGNQIAAVVVGPSGMTVNDVPILELQIHPRAGQKTGFLAGRNDPELQWLAAVLRQALGVSSAPPTADGGPRKTG